MHSLRVAYRKRSLFVGWRIEKSYGVSISKAITPVLSLVLGGGGAIVTTNHSHAPCRVTALNKIPKPWGLLGGTTERRSHL